MDKTQINEKYLAQATALEAEYFNVIPDGKGTKRVLKEGKTIEAFNSAHAIIWKNHQTELGIVRPPAPVINVKAEIQNIKSKLALIEAELAKETE